jgi:hypothetical protein
MSWIWKSVEVMDDRRGLLRSEGARESSPIDRSLFRGTLMGAVEGVMADPPRLGLAGAMGEETVAGKGGEDGTCCLASSLLPSKLVFYTSLLYRSY